TATGYPRLVNDVEAQQALTLEAWVQPAGTNTGGDAASILSLARFDPLTGPQQDARLPQKNDRFEGRVRTAGATGTAGSAEVTAGQLIHVAASIDGHNVITTLNVDGAVTTANNVGPITWGLNQPLQVGQADAASSAPFLGTIRFAAIYARALDATTLARQRLQG